MGCISTPTGLINILHTCGYFYIHVYLGLKADTIRIAGTPQEGSLEVAASELEFKGRIRTHGTSQDPPCTLNWGYMVPNSGYLSPNRGQEEGLGQSLGFV